jgi:hypothetical protein
MQCSYCLLHNPLTAGAHLHEGHKLGHAAFSQVAQAVLHAKAHQAQKAPQLAEAVRFKVRLSKIVPALAHILERCPTTARSSVSSSWQVVNMVDAAHGQAFLQGEQQDGMLVLS